MLESIYNFLALDERIATSGQPTASEIVSIAEAGFEVVINLAMPTSDHALANEQELVQSQGMVYIHIPVVWEKPTASNLERFLQVMAENETRRIFAHCAANMRVSVFMALYRILHLGWPKDKAFAAIYEIWEPDEIWRGFIAQALAK